MKQYVFRVVAEKYVYVNAESEAEAYDLIEERAYDDEPGEMTYELIEVVEDDYDRYREVLYD